jgi:magnesium transporter
VLTLYDRSARKQKADLGTASLPENIVWVDLLQPDPEESAFISRVTGLDIPTIEDLSEIETSSRLRYCNRAFYLSLPLVSRAHVEQALTSPVGFVLTRELLITVRFAEFMSFAEFAERDLAPEFDPLASAGVFAGLMDAISDHLADILESIASELDGLSTGCSAAGRSEGAGTRERRFEDHPASGRS